MMVSFKPITCGNIILASTTFIPESLSEKFIGLRGTDLVRGVGMIFEASNSIIEVFDTFWCRSIGYLALDEHYKVIKKGIMKPNKIKFIKCKYWLEVHPDFISKIKQGDTISGIQ